MSGKIYLSTAYLPPAEYFAYLVEADEAMIEKEENYLKQSYRNRCYILSASGPQVLTVPVYLGSFHKTPVKDICIDYSKRWQQIHLGAIVSSYSSSPYFQFYYEIIEKVIQADFKFLLDLNMELLQALLKILRVNTRIACTADFKPVTGTENDYRYKISPKKKSEYSAKKYLQVFDSDNGFVPGLSIIDLVFNTGPEAIKYL